MILPAPLERASRSITPEIPSRSTTMRPAPRPSAKPTTKPQPAVAPKQAIKPNLLGEWRYRGILVDPVVIAVDQCAAKEMRLNSSATLTYRGVEVDPVLQLEERIRTQAARAKSTEKLMYRGIYLQQAATKLSG